MQPTEEDFVHILDFQQRYDTLLELVPDMEQALLWCHLASDDFGTVSLYKQGKAQIGWAKLCKPVLARARAVLEPEAQPS